MGEITESRFKEDGSRAFIPFQRDVTDLCRMGVYLEELHPVQAVKDVDDWLMPPHCVLIVVFSRNVNRGLDDALRVIRGLLVRRDETIYGGDVVTSGWTDGINIRELSGYDITFRVTEIHVDVLRLETEGSMKEPGSTRVQRAF